MLKAIVPEAKVLLKDGSIIMFSPQSEPQTSNFIFKFQQNYTDSALLNHKHSPPCYSGPLFDPSDCSNVESGYESVATQDNSRPSPHNLSDLYRQMDIYREENTRLKQENSKFFAQLKQQTDHFLMFAKDNDLQRRKLDVRKVKLDEREVKLDKKYKQCKILMNQVAETKRKEKCVLSESELNQFSGGISSAVLSNVLKEITCSICSEYMVSPTSLNCSHVFCGHCIDEWKRECRSNNTSNNGICPVCRKEVYCQTQVLAFENVITLVLDCFLDSKEKEERSKIVEYRQKHCSSVAAATPQQMSVNSLLQLLSVIPRSRRSSIVITSDSDNDDSNDGHILSDGESDVVELVSNHPSSHTSNVDIELIAGGDYSFSDESDSSDSDFSRSISITVSGGSQNDNARISLDLELGTGSEEDSDDEILMIEDDDSGESDDSTGEHSEEDVIIGFYNLDDESQQDAIVISDSEDERRIVAKPSGRRRRSSLIILSDSEDSRPACRNSHQNGLNSTEIITISNDEAVPGGSNSLRRNGGGRSRSRRSHPYRRSGQNNNNNNTNNNNNRQHARRATLCA